MNFNVIYQYNLAALGRTRVAVAFSNGFAYIGSISLAVPVRCGRWLWFSSLGKFLANFKRPMLLKSVYLKIT